MDKTAKALFDSEASYFREGISTTDKRMASVISGQVPVLVSKRLIDLFLGLVLLSVTLPLFLLLAILVKLDSPGPVIYADRRLGQGGRIFRCYKFRTMYTQSIGLLKKHWQDNPESKEEWDRYGKLKQHDPRVTRWGKWLRKSSLDELPQLWNVIKGEMSLVGPRPYLVDEKPAMGEYAEAILSVNPGITGLWQVSGRNELEFGERLQIDFHYVNHRNYGLDCRILLRTVAAVISRKGAY